MSAIPSPGEPNYDSWVRATAVQAAATVFSAGTGTRDEFTPWRVIEMASELESYVRNGAPEKFDWPTCTTCGHRADSHYGKENYCFKCGRRCG